MFEVKCALVSFHPCEPFDWGTPGYSKNFSCSNWEKLFEFLTHELIFFCRTLQIAVAFHSRVYHIDFMDRLGGMWDFLPAGD